MNAAAVEIRPSALPKLALCRHYLGETDAGEAADRGTRLDVVFREMIESDWPSGTDAPGLEGDDAEAVRWAVETVRLLAGGEPLDAREEALRVESIPGINPGTADLLCSARDWSADLKTGQVRNYYEQQAAYALGFMDSHFVEEWTVYLLFCDARELVTLRYTREEAERCLREVLAHVRGDAPPVPNEYCGWCAYRWRCPARREALGIGLEDGLVTELEALPSDRLRDFIVRAKVVEDYHDKAKELIKARLAGGEKIERCKLVSMTGRKVLSTQALEHNIKALGFGNVFAAYGPMPEGKAREVWAKCPDLPFPEDQLSTGPGHTQLRISPPKKNLTAGKTA